MNKKVNRDRKRGQVGLDTAQNVMLAVLTIGVLAVLIIILLGNLTNTNASATTGSGTQVDTVTNVAHTARLFSVGTLEDCSASVVEVRNVTNLVLIPSTNYTLGACSILYKTGQGNANGFNNSDWQVNYTYTYNSFATINSNISTGTTSFFGNTSTWFSLLAVVIIILIIALVIFAVRAFRGNSRSF